MSAGLIRASLGTLGDPWCCCSPPTRPGDLILRQDSPGEARLQPTLCLDSWLRVWQFPSRVTQVLTPASRPLTSPPGDFLLSDSERGLSGFCLKSPNAPGAQLPLSLLYSETFQRHHGERGFRTGEERVLAVWMARGPLQRFHALGNINAMPLLFP